MPTVPTPVVTLYTGNTVVADPKTVAPNGLEHKGRVLFVARATGTGTWSITFRYSAMLAIGVHDSSEVRTLTVTNATPGGIVTMAHETAAKNFLAWVSAVSGTVANTSGISVEG